MYMLNSQRNLYLGLINNNNRLEDNIPHNST